MTAIVRSRDDRPIREDVGVLTLGRGQADAIQVDTTRPDYESSYPLN